MVLEFATCRYGILRLLFRCSGGFRISFRDALGIDIFALALLEWEYREYAKERRHALEENGYV